MELYFLGTVAGTPSKERNVTSIVLKLLEERGSCWMFDCGEGTQHQILRSSLKLSRLEKIFITHLHGDHIFGLPGLLTSRSNQNAKSPLTLYGPPGLKTFVEQALTVSKSRLEYDLFIHEIEEEGVIFQDNQFVVSTKRLVHRVESFGYRIEEIDLPGRLDVVKLKQDGVPPGPVYAQLKKGENIALDDGRKINSADYIGDPIPGRTIVICGDTRRCDSSKVLAERADVLVHEATFNESLVELAHKYYHTTAKQAAQLAKDSLVKTLILTHISSRYQGKEESELLEEAHSIHPNTYVANDFWTYYIPRKDMDSSD